MGLAVEVGYLADMLSNDEEGAEWFRKELQRLNQFLALKNLQPHQEPEKCKVFSGDMFGYYGIHYLRRLAAHFDIYSKLPTPGEAGARDLSMDPSIKKYYQLAKDRKPSGFFGMFKKAAKAGKFDHIIFHNYQGYYLPQDFESVLSPPEEFEITGVVGSSYRLKAECEVLAAALTLPLTMDVNDEKLFAATQSQGSGDSIWQKYGIESNICAMLYRAAEHSINTGAAIVFC